LQKPLFFAMAVGDIAAHMVEGHTVLVSEAKNDKMPSLSSVATQPGHVVLESEMKKDQTSSKSWSNMLFSNEHRENQSSTDLSSDSDVDDQDDSDSDTDLKSTTLAALAALPHFAIVWHALQVWITRDTRISGGVALLRINSCCTEDRVEINERATDRSMTELEVM
jgi:hypothetical protein